MFEYSINTLLEQNKSISGGNGEKYLLLFKFVFYHISQYLPQEGLFCTHWLGSSKMWKSDAARLFGQLK